MSDPTELPDLDRLEALARASATGDDYQASDNMHAMLRGSAVLALIEIARRARPEDEAPQAEAYDRFIALRKILKTPGYCNGTRYTEREAFNMAITILRHQAKAPQAEPVACVNDKYSRDGYNDEIDVLLPVGTKLYTHPPAAQHAESGTPAIKITPWHERLSAHKTKWHRLPPSPEDFMKDEIAELRAALVAQTQGAQAALPVYAETDSGMQLVESGTHVNEYHHADDVRRALAAQSQGAHAPQLSIGFANNDQGVHVSIMQQQADGSITVLHQARVPAGDSFTRFALAAKAEAPLDDDELARLRRVVRALGMEKEVPQDDATLRGCLFSVLGMIALKLERAQQAAAPGEAEVSAEEARLYRDLTGDAMAMGYEGIVAALAALKAAPSAPGTPEAPADVRKAALEEAAAMAEKIADDYSEKQGGKWPELRDDAATGAGDCAAAIRERAAQLDGGQGEGA